MDKLKPITIDGIPIFECAFTPEPERYYVKQGNHWIPYSERNLKLRLRDEGLSIRVARGANLSPVEAAIRTIQDERKVDYASPLAGWESGILHIRGKRILVTEGAAVHPAEDVPFPHLSKYLTQLLGSDALPHHIGWWQWGRKNIAGTAILPSQVPIYIGPAGAGKSFLQKITTRLLGGRDASPFDYMSGRTSFNSELFYAEHLVIEDRFFERGIGSRREFGATIKELAVNHVQKCHAKGKQGVTLWPKWRISISLNDEKENLNVLPPLDASLLDKVMLFTCGVPTFPVDLGTTAGWERWDQIVDEEMPGLAHYIDNFELGSYAAPRYGVKPWHDAALLECEQETAPEYILLQCLRHDLPLVLSGAVVWDGTALELERLLTATAMPSREQTRRILSWPAACGTYLGRLAKRYPKGITKRLIRGITRWTLDLGELK